MPNAADISRIDVLAYPRSPNKCAAFSISSARLSPIAPSAVSLVFEGVTLALWGGFLVLGLGVVMGFIGVGGCGGRRLDLKFSVHCGLV